ncbi:hypothetical protein AXFE_23470 [Acidithrix ferrooxidans]|uniref:Uncharacterized protein n=1 Tax=Acidithrix ferrooxidans TaxID=1280514 RepID=A0A0D8HFR7_9ACTN|nr:hypothetical protein AXFE_23470 [Acidithrix ferrooxidans]
MVVDLGMSVLEMLSHLAVSEVVFGPLALQECVEASEFFFVVFGSGIDSPTYLLASGSSIKEDIINNIFRALVRDGAIYWQVKIEGETADFITNIVRAFANRLSSTVSSPDVRSYVANGLSYRQ